MRRPYPTGGHLTQRGFRRGLNQVIDAHFPQVEAAIGISAACRVPGKSRATLHRQRNPKPAVPPAGRKEFHRPAELSHEEKDRVLAVLDSPRFADKAVAQAYTILLDEGSYLCSQATMHRLLRERGTSGERRARAAHPAKKKPELLAAGPNEVWSWDITKLKGPARGIWYLLYVILDIYSRKAVHWQIWPAETGTLAKEFIEHAITANGGTKPRAVHADRGTSMTSNTVAGLYAKLNIAQSHSRPHVSDGNPFSEAQFKTLKYCPRSPANSGPSRTRMSSAAHSSPTTTPSTGIPASRCTPRHQSTTAPGPTSRPAVPPPPGRVPRAPRTVPRTMPAAQDPARQGVDQRATRHHRDQHPTTNRTSSLMSHRV